MCLFTVQCSWSASFHFCFCHYSTPHSVSLSCCSIVSAAVAVTRCCLYFFHIRIFISLFSMRVFMSVLLMFSFVNRVQCTKTLMWLQTVGNRFIPHEICVCVSMRVCIYKYRAFAPELSNFKNKKDYLSPSPYKRFCNHRLLQTNKSLIFNLSNTV